MATTKTEADPEIGFENLDDETTTADFPLLEEKHPNRLSRNLARFKGGPYKSNDKKKDGRQRYLAIARHAILIVLAIVGIVSLMVKTIKHFEGPPLGYVECHCGSSTKEALAMGCKFDLLGPSWAPDRCRDDELTAEFLKAGTGPNGTWEFWWDHEHTMPMSIEEVSLLANDPKGAFYGSWEFHVKHCTYQWRKHTRSLMRGKTKMDMENVGLGHIQHCEGVILRQLPVRAKIPLNVPHLGWTPIVDHDDLHTSPDIGHHHGVAEHK